METSGSWYQLHWLAVSDSQIKEGERKRESCSFHTLPGTAPLGSFHLLILYFLISLVLVRPGIRSRSVIFKDIPSVKCSLDEQGARRLPEETSVRIHKCKTNDWLVDPLLICHVCNWRSFKPMLDWAMTFHLSNTCCLDSTVLVTHPCLSFSCHLLGRS